MKQELLMLAQKFNSEKISPAGYYLSEKLDGMRCFWDGGASREIPAKEVPYANVAKDGRYKEEVIATGLWSRYGKVIQAPDWFLDNLPQGICVDGELYGGIGNFQKVMSIVKVLEPGPEWQEIKYKIFDAPNPKVLFGDREINNPQMSKVLSGCFDWWIAEMNGIGLIRMTFEDTLKWLGKELVGSVAELHEQERLVFDTTKAIDRVYERLEEVTNAGGEGLILRKPSSLWVPERAWTMLKVKKLQDAEGIVVGYKAGKETDKGSKLLGLMGSLRVRINMAVIREFDISGFTDEEREMVFLDGSSAKDYLSGIPGEVVPDKVTSLRFPRGSVISFRYRELTNAGLPKEAKYWRKR